MSITNIHGGDLDEVSRLYHIDKSKIINFGGNVNPLGLPSSVKKVIKENVDLCINYPDVSYLELRKSISSYIGVDYNNILIGNGSTELISGFIKYISPTKAVIVSPAYSEYLKEIKSVGGKAELFELKYDKDFVLDIDKFISILTPDIDMAVICNPNNPTGTYIKQNQIEYILKHCEKHHIKLMIDETYVEFAEEKISAMPLADKYKNLFVIRGTSKFFACPGLRLGYGVCSDKTTADYINSHKDLWSVNVFAELAGKVMFLDKKFITDTLSLIYSERHRIIQEFGKIKGIRLFPSQSNFFLCEITDDNITSDFLFNELIKKGILIRNCSDFPYLSNKFIRFCILSKKDNSLLIDNFKNILGRY